MSYPMVDLEPLSTVDVRIHTRELTKDQFVAFVNANPDLRIERTAGGEVIVLPPASSRTGFQNGEIVFQLLAWARKEATGVGFTPDTGFELPNGAIRGPDASWVLQSRIDALAPEQKSGYYPLCPDFALELRSPSDHLVTVREKMHEYIDNGVRLAWLIDPKHRRVYVYRPGVEEQVLENPSTLSGDPELPGFTLELARIWDPGF